MNMDQVGTSAVALSQTPNQIDARWQGRRLVLARVGWVIVLVLSLGVFIARIPFNFADLHILCTSACRNTARLTLAQVHELHHLGLSLDFWASFELVLSLIFEIGYVATGMLIFWRRSDERMAFITSLALVTFGNAFSPAPVTSLPPMLHVLSLWMAFFGSICIALFSYTFPTGQFMPRWAGFLAAIWIALWGITNLALASFFQPAGLATLLFFSLLASMVVVQVYRYRHVSTPTQHQQMKWVVFGLAVGLLGFLIVVMVEMNVPLGIMATMVVNALLFACLLIIPTSITIAILRYRLWDIDLIINRTLVYGTLTLGVAGCYVLIVGGLGTLVEARGNFLLSLLATGLIAVLFQPVHMQLQKAVNRLMYGERDEPYQVISRLGSRLEATLASEAVLPTIVETVAQALKLPYAAITLKQDGEYVVAASYGQIAAELVVLPLVYQNEQIGELLLVPRAIGESFTRADRALLNDLARQAGIAVHAVRLTMDLQRLTQELQRSRTQLVTAREEERRRLRRDLHDGLGSVLASLNWRAGAIRSLLSRDPATADTLVVEQQNTIQAAIADIRRLVYDLRPPALDELGLVGAIRERAAQQSTPAKRDDAQGLRIDVVAPDPLLPLPAAIEVAAYRIVQEALTNVIHHAHASKCSIRLAYSEEALRIEIIDDGTGLPAGYHVGVGLVSMRERAEELGGTCEISSAPGGGTRVQTCFPLAGEGEGGEPCH